LRIYLFDLRITPLGCFVLENEDIFWSRHVPRHCKFFHVAPAVLCARHFWESLPADFHRHFKSRPMGIHAYRRYASNDDLVSLGVNFSL
jgi:hypothetical protein